MRHQKQGTFHQCPWALVTMGLIVGVCSSARRLPDRAQTVPCRCASELPDLPICGDQASAPDLPATRPVGESLGSA